MSWDRNKEDWNRHHVANQALRAKYPEFRLPPFECLSGWNGLLEKLFIDLREIIPQERWEDLSVMQIKEKFGTLRFYVSLGGEPVVEGVPDIHEKIMLAVFLAECRSELTCEICGEPGRFRDNRGWYTTRCDYHSEGGEAAKDEKLNSTMEMSFADGSGRKRRLYRYDRASDSIKEMTDDR